MTLLDSIKTIVADILDMDAAEISEDAFLMRDLGAESIDLLELAVALNAEFNTTIVDDDLFLRKLRLYLQEAEKNNADKKVYLARIYPFLDESRIAEIIDELTGGPVLKVADLKRYIAYQQQNFLSAEPS